MFSGALTLRLKLVSDSMMKDGSLDYVPTIPARRQSRRVMSGKQDYLISGEAWQWTGSKLNGT